MDVIYADAQLRELGFLPFAEGDFTVGLYNTFSLKVPPDLSIAEGSYLMLDGTEYGGRVDGLDIETDADYVTAVGRTWHGLLGTALVKPSAGESHLVESGECNAVVGRLVERLGLSYCMAASDADSGFSVSGWRFTREGESMDGYSQIRSMLRSVGAKLRIRYDGARRRAVLSAVPVGDYRDSGIDGDLVPFRISTRRPVNHLHCMGVGEGAARVVLDLYADRNGAVSRHQTLTGPYHCEEAYDNPAAELAELEEYGARRLAEYQADLRKCSIKGQDDGSYEIDDIVGGTSTRHGVSVETRVAVKVAAIDEDGNMTYETQTEMEV